MRRGTALALALAGSLATRPAAGGEWVADPAASRVVVHAFKAGILRAFAHDHHFAPGRWSARARLDPERPADVKGALVVDASSLRDGQGSLSAEDRAKVDRQVADGVLEASRFPEVRFDVTGFEPSGDPSRSGEPIRGSLKGRLSLRGVERDLSAPVELEISPARIAVRGRAVLSRRDFGVEVPGVALGAVSVKDRVEIEFSLVLRPDARDRAGG